MANSVAEQAAEGDAETVGGVPDADFDGLFAAGVPHAGVVSNGRRGRRKGEVSARTM